MVPYLGELVDGRELEHSTDDEEEAEQVEVIERRCVRYTRQGVTGIHRHRRQCQETRHAWKKLFFLKTH